MYQLIRHKLSVSSDTGTFTSVIKHGEERILQIIKAIGQYPPLTRLILSSATLHKQSLHEQRHI